MVVSDVEDSYHLRFDRSHNSSGLVVFNFLAEVSSPMKIRKAHFTFPVFNYYTVRVVVAPDTNAALAGYRDLKEFVEKGRSREARVFSSNSHHCYMFLPSGASVRTIAHECWHVVKTMMDYTGIKLENEVVAYHMGYLTQKVYDFVQKDKR